MPIYQYRLFVSMYFCCLSLPLIFFKALEKAITEAREADPHQERLNNFEVVDEDLQINVYLGLGAMIYNQSGLGFCKDRGSVFFWSLYYLIKKQFLLPCVFHW